MLALVALLVVVALALMLFYRVYVHHTRVDPYGAGGPTIVDADVNFSRAVA